MSAELPQLKSHLVEVFTSSFQVSGHVSMMGDFLLYVNDQNRNTLAITEAQITPLRKSWRIGDASRPEIVVPKAEVHLVLVGELGKDNFTLFPREERLIVYTDTYVVNAALHLGAETPVSEAFHATAGPFFPATEAEVFSVMPLTVDVHGAASVAFINREHVGAFYLA